MNYTEAQFWAKTITDLLAGHRVIIIDACQWQGWQPYSNIVTLEKAWSANYKHSPENGFFSVATSYGVHSGGDTVSINADDHEIVMYSANMAAGEPSWRVIRDLDKRDWKAWRDAQAASWKIRREPQTQEA